jgi:hypothetical protein
MGEKLTIGIQTDKETILLGMRKINPLTPELNPSAQHCLTRFLMGILIFKGLIARRLYKSFGVKGLINQYL